MGRSYLRVPDRWDTTDPNSWISQKRKSARQNLVNFIVIIFALIVGCVFCRQIAML